MENNKPYLILAIAGVIIVAICAVTTLMYVNNSGDSTPALVEPTSTPIPTPQPSPEFVLRGQRLYVFNQSGVLFSSDITSIKCIGGVFVWEDRQGNHYTVAPGGNSVCVTNSSTFVSQLRTGGRGTGGAPYPDVTPFPIGKQPNDKTGSN